MPVTFTGYFGAGPGPAAPAAPATSAKVRQDTMPPVLMVTHIALSLRTNVNKGLDTDNNILVLTTLA
jgi:hypothetical protein